MAIIDLESFFDTCAKASPASQLRVHIAMAADVRADADTNFNKLPIDATRLGESYEKDRPQCPHGVRIA